MTSRGPAVTVLHVIANRWWTGAAEPALGTASALRARGHRVLFACVRGDALEERARAVGLPPVPGLSLTRTARPWILAADVARLRHLMRDAAVDVVHAHQSHDHWLATLAATGRPVAVVRSIHHRRAVRGGLLTRWLLRRTRAVLAASEGIAEAVRTRGLPAARLAVVPGAVDPERFRPGPVHAGLRAELGVPADAFVVGCVARMVRGRGHDVLLEALRLARHPHPELRLVLIGRGEARPWLERRVRDLELGEVVRFAGYRGEDLPDVLRGLDVLALLAPGSEESCRAVLEGMAAGLPVVAGRGGALPETVVDGMTGWLVNPTPAEVAGVLARMAADPGAARELGRAGRARVLSLFTPDRRARVVEAVYEAVLSKCPWWDQKRASPP